MSNEDQVGAKQAELEELAASWGKVELENVEGKFCIPVCIRNTAEVTVQNTPLQVAVTNPIPKPIAVHKYALVVPRDTQEPGDYTIPMPAGEVHVWTAGTGAEGTAEQSHCAFEVIVREITQIVPTGKPATANPSLFIGRSGVVTLRGLAATAPPVPDAPDTSPRYLLLSGESIWLRGPVAGHFRVYIQIIRL